MVKKSVVSVLLGLATSLALSPAFAQENAIEEIIVTASKRAQTLQEVPIAVSVVSADTIEKAQINDILDLQTLVPSLRITQLQTTGNTNFVIRGFGNGANNPGIEPSVGVFIDGVYRSRSAAALADMPNVERVEVLRGPQSTLFGKNASAGVINVVTAAPNMDAIGGSASLVYGNYNQVIVKGDIDGPISDTWGFGLSASVNQRDGYFENLTSGSLLNERDRWGARGQLLWLPSDSLTLRLIADTEEINEKCCGVANLFEDQPIGTIIGILGGPFVGDDAYAREQYYNLDPFAEIANSGVSLQIDWDFGNDMLLTSITAFRDQSRFEDSDSDFSNADLLQKVSTDTNIETLTQELRLSQSLDSLDWMIGGYYFDEEVRYDAELEFGTAFRPYADIASQGAVTQIEGLLGFPAGTFQAQGDGDIEISTSNSQKIHTDHSSLYNNQFAIAWEDDGNSSTIKAQNLIIGDTSGVSTGIVKHKNELKVIELRDDKVFILSSEDVTRIDFYNMYGQMIQFNYIDSDNPIELSGKLPSGIYFAVALDRAGKTIQVLKFSKY